MKDFGTMALNNRVLVYFIVGALIIGGLRAFYTMSKLEDPEIPVKQALVVTACPGANSHEVEMEVTDVIERAIRTMKNIEYVESRSMNDVSIITVNLSTLVNNRDTEQHWDMLRRKVGDATRDLPTYADNPRVIDDFGDVYGMFYAMTADGYEENEIADHARLIQRDILAIEGVTRVNIYGTQEECIEIEFDESVISSLGIVPLEIISAINGHNNTLYAGYFETPGNRVRISVEGKNMSLEDIENITINGHQKDKLTIKNVATVRKSIEKPVRNLMRYDGKKAVGLAIAAHTKEDITKVGKLVENKLIELQDNRLPAGIEVHKIFNQPDRVNDSITTFMTNLVESLIIVILILMLTMGIRSGVIIGTSLVITVIGSFVILKLFGGTLQRVSLAAFILAMGMLVDNAIVIVDGILIDMKRGISRNKALTTTGKKTSMPLLAATMIAVLAFFPIFLSPDTSGVYVRDLFIVLAVSLLLSWLLALTQVPLQAALMLKTENPTKKEDIYNNVYYTILRRILQWSLSHRVTIIVSAITMIVMSAVCYRYLPKGFFPDLNYDQLYIEYKLPEGTTSDKVSKDIEEIEQYLLKTNEIKHVVTSIGGTPARYNLVRSMADPSLAYGELIVDFESPKVLTAKIDEIQKYLTGAYPDAFVRLKRYNLMYKPFPIEVLFTGPDPSVLKELSKKAMDIMNKSAKVTLVTTNMEPKIPVIKVEYENSNTLSRQDIAMSVLASHGGIPISNFYEGTNRRNIYIKMTNKDRQTTETLKTMPIFNILPNINRIPTDNNTIQGLITGSIAKEDLIQEIFGVIPMSESVKDIKITWEPPVIIRYNGQRAVKAQCNPATSVSVEDARKNIAEAIEKITLPSEYSMEWQGEHKVSKSATKYLFAHLPLAIILIIVILIALFKDYRQPLIITIYIPLIMVGVVIAIMLTGKTFGFVAVVAALGLIGMMIKNGIVLIDETTSRINAGNHPQKALIDSVISRFRPVTMASLTTILGMIPLVSDDMFGSGAVTIMGGLIFGTIVTLIILPVLYSIIFKVKTGEENRI
ncbi:MAG: efflux RND transporter permease subunit [Dysgonamonadaceae bacterium]|nr:efflux RND transporter permease subunit [Dysgonamonadaceae bacterium]